MIARIALFVGVGLLAQGCGARQGPSPAARQTIAVSSAVSAPLAPAPAPETAESLGLKIVPGFRVTQFSDAAMANDLYAMTLNPDGEVVVSSAGWIKRLRDRDGDGRADDAEVIAKTDTGSMGLQYIDGALVSFQDNGLWRYPVGAHGIPTGPPEKLLTMVSGEHGGHIARKGPDGWLYFLASNASKLAAEHITSPASPIRTPNWGGILRLSPDLKTRELIADGLRNPYRFDFTPAGDLIAYEANGERDVFLPWYLPTRLFHVVHGGHHGWLNPGWQRSFVRSEDYPDATPILSRLGEGSPTGVACYRHTQFPAKYRGGLFVTDWTFGRVWFVPLDVDGGSYRTPVNEIFLETASGEGFAPVDTVVAPDGALLVAIGGRGTRGAVYRIVADGAAPAAAPPSDDVLRVLRAPQPLDAWSRARWEPLAHARGSTAFATVLSDESAAVADRVRAIEVLTDTFGGLPPAAAQAASRSRSAELRARAAWSIGRAPTSGGQDDLIRLADDEDARVRARALEAVADRYGDKLPPAFAATLARSLAHADARVRHAAVHLASRLPDLMWQALAASPVVAATGRWATIGVALARIWRTPAGRTRGLVGPGLNRDATLASALAVLDGKPDPLLAIAALRLVALAFGDWKLDAPPVEVQAPYTLTLPVPPALARRILDRTRPMFPSGNDRLDEELARMFALLEDRDARTPAKLAAEWTASSSVTRDLHYLVALSRLPGRRTAAVTAATAGALLALPRKLTDKNTERLLQNWEVRAAETARALQTVDPRLSATIARHEALVEATELGLVMTLPAEDRAAAIRRFLPRLAPTGPIPWSARVVELVGELPSTESRPLLRARWETPTLRDEVVLALSRSPEAQDRARFLEGLASFQPVTVAACVDAIDKVGPDREGNDEAALLRLLRRSMSETGDKAIRARVTKLLERETQQAFPVEDSGGPRAAQEIAYAPLFDWFSRHHPALLAALGNEGEEDPAAFAARLGKTPWERGDAARGEALVGQRACLSCHTGTHSLGPSLVGAAQRMSREDLFAAIAWPSRDIAPAYRPLVVELRDGDAQTGIVVYESADVLMLQTGPNLTMRIPGETIARQHPGATSLMPAGLLAGLTGAELADVYAYLKTLR